MEKVKCPCGHETDTPIHWENVVQGFPFSLSSKEFGNVKETYPIDSDNNEWACPSCGLAYPRETQKALDEAMHE